MDSPAASGRLHGISINRLIPNMLTLAALCSGLTAIRFASAGRDATGRHRHHRCRDFDALDGRVARRLGVTSRFGAELNSLSDFLCFGVAPALVLYLASLKDGGALGWVVTLMFPICSALRLARFNTALLSDTPPPAWTELLFHGRSGAGRRVAGPDSPGRELRDRGRLAASPAGGRAVLVLVGGLMVSRMPTYSFKKGRVPRHLVLPSLLVRGAVDGGDRQLALDRVVVDRHRLDVTKPHSIAAALETSGPIDALVNNAGIGVVGAFEATPMATTREVFETNTFGVIAMTQAVLPAFRARRSGVVVNVTSSVTLAPMPLAAVYTASKMAIEGFTGSLALELEASTCGSNWSSLATARPRALRATPDRGWKG